MKKINGYLMFLTILTYLFSGCKVTTEYSEPDVGFFEATITGDFSLGSAGLAHYGYIKDPQTQHNAVVVQLIDRSGTTSIGFGFTGKEVVFSVPETYQIVHYAEESTLEDIAHGDFFAVYLDNQPMYEREFRSVEGVLEILEFSPQGEYVRGSFEFVARGTYRNAENPDSVATINATGTFRATKADIAVN